MFYDKTMKRNQKGKEEAMKGTNINKTCLQKEEAMKADTINKNRRGIRYVLLAAGLFIIITGLAVQPLMAKSRGWSGPRYSPEEILQTLTERLDLTAEQINVIRPIIEEKHRKMIEIGDELGDDRKAARTERMKLKWEAEMQLGAILTDEQVDKYLELKEERREQRHRGKFGDGRMGRGLNRSPEQMLERMSSRLGLTEEQAAQAEPILKESIAKRRAVFDKYSGQKLTEKESMRNEMQSIGDETHAQLSTILTDEQMETLNKIKEEKRSRFNRDNPVGF